jgi:haloalkane dehalogenase
MTESRLPEFASKPCLLAWGMKDFVFDHHFLRQWKQVFPHAKVLEYPDCGHYIFEDGGEALTRLISDFMDENKHGINEG